jgi:uroporphyrinogen III methyltransferase/synthase
MSRARPPVNPEPLPLAGLRVAVTRPADDAGELAALLERAGAATVLIPLTRILPAADEAPLRRALEDLDRFDWIVFTSANAVRAVARTKQWRPVRPRIAAVGPATAAAVHMLTGRMPDAVPAGAAGSGIVPAMLELGTLQGARILWPRAEQPRPELPRHLIRAGAVVEDPVAYRTVPDASAAGRLAEMTAIGGLDAITFTAPSAVDCFADAAVGQVQCIIAVIGPATAAAARARGLPVHVEAERPIISALVAALARFHNRGSPHQQ